MKKRVLAFMLCIVLMLSLVPAVAAATEIREPEQQSVALTAAEKSVLTQRRQAAYDTMLGMATVLWRATEDINYTFGGSQVNIKAGRLYRGMPYAYARGNLEAFLEYAGEPNEKGEYSISGLDAAALESGSQYARVGNDCAGAATVAYGSIGASVKNAGAGSQCPDNGYLRVAEELYTTKPDSNTNENGIEVCQANGEQVMYSIYAQATLADLWVCSGHTMMNRNVQIKYNEDGTINGEESVAIVVHQTPGFIREGYYYQDGGAYTEANYGEKVYIAYRVDERKTFKWLYDNGYMPANCLEFRDPNAVPADAVISDTETVYSYDNILEGTLSSNRFIETVTVTIADAQGSTVQQASARGPRADAKGTVSDMSFDLARFTRESPAKMKGWVDPTQLAPGNYHCTVTARLMTGQILTARDFDFAVTSEDLGENWVDNSPLTSTTGTCPACGAPVTWKPLPEAKDDHVSLTTGHYYLEGDLTENLKRYKITSANVCVHLNGHDISTTDVPFYLGANATLRMMGHGNVKGAFNSSSAYYAGGIAALYGTSKVYLYGGTYGHDEATTRATITLANGAKVYMYDGATIRKTGAARGPQVYIMSGTFEMFGGKILDGDNRKSLGGNIVIGDGNNTEAKFIQHGGVIADGRAQHGGNVYINGTKSSFVQNGGLLHMGFAGYLTKDGKGGNIYMATKGSMQLDGTVAYGKAYAGGGNVMATAGGTISVGGTVTAGNGDYGSAGGKSGGNINIAGGTGLTVTGTVSNPITKVAYGGNIFASASSITVDGGKITGGETSSRGGNIYLTASNVSLLLKNGGEISGGKSASGGNIATNSATCTITLENGTVKGGSASTGSNICLYAAATLDIQNALVDGAIYAGAGTVKLSGSAQAMRSNHKGIDFDNGGKLIVDASWTGNAGVNWKTAYTFGQTVAETDGTCGDYTGKLYYPKLTAIPEIKPVDGKLVVGATQIVGMEESRWAASNQAAVAQVGEGEYLKLYTAEPLDLDKKEVYVDFNGKADVAVSNGTLLGMDSTATYEAAGTGSALVTGTVQTDVFAPDGKRYVALTDGEKTTFHALNMYISSVTVRPGEAGIYYGGTWECDQQLQTALQSYGIALSTVDMPDANFKNDRDTLYTAFGKEQFGRENQGNSVIVRKIVKETSDENSTRGMYDIYAAAYMMLEDGTCLISTEPVAYSLHDVLTILERDLEEKYASYATALQEFMAHWSQYGLTGKDWDFDFSL